MVGETISHYKVLEKIGQGERQWTPTTKEPYSCQNCPW